MSNDSTILETEVVVIGAGPGGYAAAFRAADNGKEVLLIDDRERPGGVCLHVGCIPSKALLHVAEVLALGGEAKNWGVAFNDPEIDLDRLRDWKQGVVDRLVGGLEKLVRARKVRFLHGRAVFIDSERLRIEDSPTEIVKFKHCIVATGSHPVIPKMFADAGPRVMTSTGALDLPDVPPRFLVVGGGYIGLELATVYAALGSKVTVVELESRLLTGVDRELVRPVQRRLEKRVESIRLNTRVEKIEREGEELNVTIKGEDDKEETLKFDRALLAVGRRPSTSGLGVGNTKARMDDRGFIRVNAARRTDDPNIFAIGDVAGEPLLAHKATHEGIVAADALCDEPAGFDPAAIPAVVYTDPEIAWTGLTETEAKAGGTNVTVRRFGWAASGRALSLDRTEGMTKILCDPESGLVLGMGIVGVGAGELIAEATLAIEMGATAEDLAATIHPHPTLSETLMESGELFLGSSTHMFRPPGGK